MDYYHDCYSPTRQPVYAVLSKERELLPGVKWGDYCQLYTPAFWKHLYETNVTSIQIQSRSLGESLLEEVVACLLGGYGIPSEIGWLAFQRLKKDGLIYKGVALDVILKALQAPFYLKEGKPIHYRFSTQKSTYIYRFLNRKDLEFIHVLDDTSLRNWLLQVDGIGPKTASWITRNWLKSEQVAILDIHLLRAGQLMGLFKRAENVSLHYLSMEDKYLKFCQALDVLPSIMDEVIWSFMKRSNTLALRILNYRRQACTA